MLVLIKWIRSLAKAIASESQPWQIGVATALGLLLGLLDWWQVPGGPNPLVLILLAALFWINVHLGSGMLFMAIGGALQLILGPMTESLADMMVPIATIFADIPLTYALHLSHTDNLAILLYGVPTAIVTGLCIARLSRYFQEKLREKIAERKKLKLAGKTATNPWLLKLACWFLDI